MFINFLKILYLYVIVFISLFYIFLSYEQKNKYRKIGRLFSPAQQKPPFLQPLSMGLLDRQPHSRNLSRLESLVASNKDSAIVSDTFHYEQSQNEVCFTCFVLQSIYFWTVGSRQIGLVYTKLNYQCTICRDGFCIWVQDMEARDFSWKKEILSLI